VTPIQARGEGPGGVTDRSPITASHHAAWWSLLSLHGEAAYNVRLMACYAPGGRPGCSRAIV
jgi:hypothetical protein